MSGKLYNYTYKMKTVNYIEIIGIRLQRWCFLQGWEKLVGYCHLTRYISAKDKLEDSKIFEELITFLYLSGFVRK